MCLTHANAGNKMKILGSKIMTVISLGWNSTWRLWQEINASRSLVLLEEDYWYVKRCVCICKLHKLNCTAIMYIDFYGSVHVHITKHDYIIRLL